MCIFSAKKLQAEKLKTRFSGTENENEIRSASMPHTTLGCSCNIYIRLLASRPLMQRMYWNAIYAMVGGLA